MLTRRRVLIASTLILTLIIDQLSKLWARQVLLTAGPYSFLDGWFRLETVQNPGAFLSLGAQWSDSTRQVIFQIGVIAILLFTSWLLWKKPWSTSHAFALASVLAGGIGNLIDRVWQGFVTDFLILGKGYLRTGVFNVADFAIVLGLLILLFPDKHATAINKK